MATETEIKEMAESLGMEEAKTVKADGKLYLLCGSNRAFEDRLTDRVHACFAELADIFQVYPAGDWLDAAEAEVRDKVLNEFLAASEGTLVTGVDEY